MKFRRFSQSRKFGKCRNFYIRFNLEKISIFLLKQKKLLLTRSDPSDKRLSIISLTQDGVELMTLLEQKGLAITRETLLPLKPTEQKRFLELLLKLS